MKQTPVEFLENQIKNSKYFYKLMEDINSKSTIAQIDIFEKAKEMEKDEIKCAWYDIITKGDKNTAEQYYLERFKKTFKFE